VATRPLGVSVICHSSVSPSLSSKNCTIDSGTVARRDGDPGLAIEILLLLVML
jgi:hypothetical protein